MRKRVKEPWRYIFTSPSSCETCHAPIPFYGLIPIVSYIALGGRCIRCKARIPFVVFAGELNAALLFLMLLFSEKSLLSAWVLLMFALHLYLTMATDMKVHLIDYENTLFLLMFAIVWVLLKYKESSIGAFNLTLSASHPMLYLLTGVALFLLFLILFIAGRSRQLGAGDLFLSLPIGIVVGFPWVIPLLQLSAAGALVHILWIHRKYKKRIRTIHAPLGFYMSLSTIAVFYIRAAMRFL